VSELRTLVAVDDFRAAAKALLPRAAWDYFDGGAGSERTLFENERAWGRHRLRPSVLADVGGATTATSVLGAPVELPVIVAPMAIQRMAHPDGEPGLARAASGAGAIFVLSTAASATPEEVAAAAPEARRWFQLDLHRDRDHSYRAIEAAVNAGYSAVVLTVDSPVPGIRRRDRRNGFVVPEDLPVPGIRRSAGGPIAASEFYAINDPTATWADLDQLVAACPVPVLVKGIQTAEDARRAVAAGVAAIIVSNHGGRQLDGAAATAEVLPEVVCAVDGSVEVLVDGGLRSGSDVAVALALGATAVLVGRPLLWGLAVAGAAGAAAVLDLLQEELLTTIALLGCTSPSELGPRHVQPPRGS
jgi:isopentenyl diphosphate isomerase/L-lactate dehydrogenase-like FMN-dependent dehydrogenase